MQLVLLLVTIPLVVGSSFFQCGVPKVRVNEVIVRGRDASPGSFPWHTAVYHRKGRSASYACGGTLISATFVLTADHCVKDDNGYVLSPKRVFARLGVHNLNVPNLQTSQHHDIFTIHRFTESKQKKNDIALLELSTQALFNQHVQPACINREEDITGQSGVAVGWGFTEDDDLSPTLKAARMPVVSTTTCLEHDRDTFGQTLDSSLFCAGYTNGTTVCNGDSGGGLHVKRGDTWYVVGIISFTAPREDNSLLCKKDSYAAFTNVATFVPWIRNVTELLSLAERGKVTVREGQDPDPERHYPNYLPRTCGNFVVSRIVGGTSANLFEFPWMALLAYKDEVKDSPNYLCGGSLINKRYVLTTANCVYPKTPFQVRLGEHDLTTNRDCNPNDANDCAPPVQDVDIDYIVRHQRHDKRARSNNIALIRLAREVIFDDHIQPICLPVTETLRKQKLQRYIVTGFGRTEYLGDVSNVLVKATVPAVEHEDCQKLFATSRAALDESHLCAGSTEDGRDTCAGDSGGPLGYPVRYNGVRFVQFGVTSFGRQCGLGPSVYTNVANLMDWILANMQA
uniref:Putative trypsin-like serine protease n=1 Tax=Culex tarsalis TaxID=7177 RepID=A0A1Q3FNL9_CULTA